MELRVLGSVELRGVEGPQARSVLAHPKRLALLTYLAAARNNAFHRRDELFALLWPDADADRARNSLRQAVHQIRRALGQDAIVARGEDEIALNPDVRSDAVLFAERLAAKDLAAALALYRGDLLSAFHVGDAPAFEEWAEAERNRLRAMASAAAWSLSQEREAAHSAAEAVTWARWAAAREPLDEVAQQRLIAALDRLGDRAGALGAYEAFASRLKAEYEAEPAAETQALIAGVRARSAALAPALRHGPAVAQDLRPEPMGPAPAVEAHRKQRPLWPFAAAVAVVAIILVTILERGLPRHAAVPLDPQLVAVAPFRVASADTSLQFLGEGLVDLLSAKLIGGGGPRAADPRAVLAAWRSVSSHGDEEAARSVGRFLGADRVVLGAVIGSPERLLITASLVGVRDGARARDASVAGPADSLPALVEQLALRLLSRELETGDWGGTTTSLEALREYLQGRAAFRRAEYDEALRHFQEATALDSTFALAALDLVYAGDWAVGPDRTDRRAMAWRLRAKLAPRDRAFLRAVLGPDYPGASPIPHRIDAWEQATRLAGDRPDAWYGLGDLLLHYGALFGRDSGFARAEAAFARAVALDSGYSAPLEHLVLIAAERGDRTAVRQLAAVAHRADSTSDAALFLRWRVAVALDDGDLVRRFEAGLDSLPLQTLRRIAEWGVLEGVHVDAAQRAARLFLRRATTSTEQEYAEHLAMLVAEDAGRFTERDSARSALLRRSHAALASPIASAWSDMLLNDGDPERLARIVPDAEARLAALPRRSTGLDALALFAWYARQPDRPSQTRADAYLDRAIAARPQVLDQRELVAMRAVRRHEPEAARLLAVMDAVRSGTSLPETREQRSLELARLLAQDGDTLPALSLVRGWAFEPAAGLRFLPARLRLQGQLAAAAGDTAGAVRAYRHYLALRHDPDPGVRPYADSVRTALARLETRSGRP